MIAGGRWWGEGRRLIGRRFLPARKLIGQRIPYPRQFIRRWFSVVHLRFPLAREFISRWCGVIHPRFPFPFGRRLVGWQLGIVSRVYARGFVRRRHSTTSEGQKW